MARKGKDTPGDTKAPKGKPRKPHGDDMPAGEAADTGAKTARTLAAWQKAALAIAGAVAVAGAGLTAYAWSTSPEPAAQQAAAGDAGGESMDDMGVQGFLPGEPTIDPGEGAEGEAPAQAEPAEQRAIDDYSPALFRLGFSFVVGFAIAYAVRTFVKISLVAIGILLLALFGLQYAGIIQVNWGAMEQHYDTAVAYLGSQLSTFQDFITGSLPSAAAAVGGMVIGFKKR